MKRPFDSFSKRAALFPVGALTMVACSQASEQAQGPSGDSGGSRGDGGGAGRSNAAGRSGFSGGSGAGDGGATGSEAGAARAAGETAEAADSGPAAFDPKALAAAILADRDLSATKGICANILSEGLNAGSGYPQVWIRDFNTFIEALLDYNPSPPVKEGLLRFFHFQGLDYVSYGGLSGNIVDTCDSSVSGNPSKNTAETDQETSLRSEEVDEDDEGDDDDDDDDDDTE